MEHRIIRLTIFLLFILVNTANAQKFISKSGTISFFSKTPLEDIYAINNKVGSVYDATTGDLVFQLKVIEFKFNDPLMEEHFNENYLESDVYPKSTFIGKVIQNKNGDVTVKGKLTMHGITKEIIANGSLSQDNEIVTIFSEFSVKLEDYEIDIPKIVMYKIAEEIEIKVNIELKQN